MEKIVVTELNIGNKLILIPHRDSERCRKKVTVKTEVSILKISGTVDAMSVGSDHLVRKPIH